MMSIPVEINYYCKRVPQIIAYAEARRSKFDNLPLALIDAFSQLIGSITHEVVQLEIQEIGGSLPTILFDSCAGNLD